MMMIDWNIQARAHVCRACQKTFADKEVMHTLLFDAAEGFERMDVCAGCWGSSFDRGRNTPKPYVSCWQSVYLEAPPPPPDAIQKETAESLLRKLIEQNDPEHLAARFILAVMLERKRILKMQAELSQEGRRVLVYEHAKTGDLFQIINPDLQLDQLEAVQRDVAQLLEQGLRQAPPADADPAPENQPELLEAMEAVPAECEEEKQEDGAEPGAATT